MKKYILLTTLLVILTISGCSRLPFGSSTAAIPVSEATAVVEKTVVRESVTVTGNIAPLKVRELGFTNDGKIISIPLSEGNKVTEGTILARIDAAQDEYNIEAMEYELELLRFSESPRKIALKEKELGSLQKKLENKVITAPFDGVIVEIKKREGEINYTSAEAGYLIKLIDDSSMKASVVVDELDISRIRIDQKAIFSFDALPGETFEGRVSKIAHIGRLNENGLPVVDVELIINSPDPRIFIPYSFKVEIITDKPVEFLVVSDKAIIWENDKTYINLMSPSGGATVKREVRIKEWKDGKTIILDGAGEGDELLITVDSKPEGLSIWM